MTDEKKWQPDTSAIMEKLIRGALANSSATKPEELPSHIRQQLKEYAAGDMDVDAYIKSLMQKIKAEQR